MTVRSKLDELKLEWDLSTDKELADKLDTSKGNIDSWVKRDKLPEKWELKIGQMPYQDITTENNLNIPIPHFDNIVASAGAGAYNEDETISLISFDKQFLKSKLGIANHKNLHTISASGDSMQPTINNGDLLFILPFENENNTIKDGAIYVLNCDSSLFVKRIRTNPIKKTLTLVSDNKDYEHIVFQGDELDMCKIVGRVTFYMGIL